MNLGCLCVRQWPKYITCHLLLTRVSLNRKLELRAESKLTLGAPQWDVDPLTTIPNAHFHRVLFHVIFAHERLILYIYFCNLFYKVVSGKNSQVTSYTSSSIRCPSGLKKQHSLNTMVAPVVSSQASSHHQPQRITALWQWVWQTLDAG